MESMREKHILFCSCALSKEKKVHFDTSRGQKTHEK